MDYYEYTSKGSTIKDNLQIDIFTFKSDIIKQTYIVEVINYDFNIYIVQFYLKCHRLSENRFSFYLPLDVNSKIDKNIRNKHFFLLLNTLTILAKEIIKKDPLASFGFMGAPTPNEKNFKKNAEKINPDKTIIETKRYRVYSLYIKRYFSPQKFTHIEYQNASCYLLKNNDNVALSFDKSNELLNKIIEEKIALN